MKKMLIGFVGFAVMLIIGSFTSSHSLQADHGRPPFAPMYTESESIGIPVLDHGRPPMMRVPY